MHIKDNLPEHLDWLEIALQSANLDFPNLRISAQSHYGPSDRFVFVSIYGVDDDRARRRQIRADAGNLLRRLGYTVEIEPGRDVYDLFPIQAESAHHCLWMTQCLLTVRDQNP